MLAYRSRAHKRWRYVKIWKCNQQCYLYEFSESSSKIYEAYVKYFIINNLSLSDVSCNILFLNTRIVQEFRRRGMNGNNVDKNDKMFSISDSWQTLMIHIEINSYVFGYEIKYCGSGWVITESSDQETKAVWIPKHKEIDFFLIIFQTHTQW